MRVLHYALGGGLGHLVRAGRFLHQQGLAASAVVVSAAGEAGDRRVLGGIATRRVPRELESDPDALRGWLARCLDELRPELVCVDCFPAGLLGELAGLEALHGVERWHLARLLRWPRYAALAHGAPRYHRAWRLEPLHPAHEAWLRRHCDALDDLPIAVPAPTGAARAVEPFWLVAHSGPRAEVGELVAHALEMRRLERAAVRILVASLDPPQPLPPDCHALDALPLADHFAAAQRIIGAAGFNLIAETGAWRGKQVIVPFPRHYDDQFERARRVRLR